MVIESSRMISHGCDIKKSPGGDTNNTHVNNTKEKRTLILKDENLRSGFAQIPNVVLQDSRVSANAVRLYCLLLSYAWQSNECFPGHKLLCFHMGCKKDTIFRAMGELKKFKLISWKRQGLGKVNIYYIERLSDGYFPKQMLDRGQNF